MNIIIEGESGAAADGGPPKARSILVAKRAARRPVSKTGGGAAAGCAGPGTVSQEKPQHGEAEQMSNCDVASNAALPLAIPFDVRKMDEKERNQSNSYIRNKNAKNMQRNTQRLHFLF